ncbi:MAG: transglutaminase domain-containing protein [candidate division Zixibacteria bacterium]|nr:transglutaminase domain-containing protein [candidate division Zixibacteria bacterium]
MQKILLRIVIVFLLFVFAWGMIDSFITFEKDIPIVETSKQVKYRFTIQNKTNKLIDSGKLWVHAPIKSNSFQSCTNIKPNFAFQLLTIEKGNQVLQFELSDLPPFATRVINIEANLIYRSLPRKTGPSNIQDYLGYEKYIESNHPDIIALAKELKRDSSFETARAIYDWVSSKIKYAGYIKNNRGALYALKFKKGDCTEFMSLFIALCRANNIAAKGVGGYTCIGNCVLEPNTYHNWAEFYENGTWLMADCQKKVFAQDNSNYIAMQNIAEDNNSPMQGFSRFKVQGSGLKIKMN